MGCGFFLYAAVRSSSDEFDEFGFRAVFSALSWPIWLLYYLIRPFARLLERFVKFFCFALSFLV